MILAHLADLHLGYRAYHRLAPGGLNARERDVALAFSTALDRVIALDVDLVLVAGDIFHTVRPSNTAIADAFRQFSRLRAALPRTPVVLIAGNHDSPRAVETGSILRLLAEIPGVIVVDDVARTVHLEALDTSILCLPHNALARPEPVALEPNPEAKTNLLMLHGTVTGGAATERLRYLSEYGGAQVETTAIQPARWDYVALGHYHIATELAPNMWYAGGIERTSTNIWEEAGAAKGFLTYDTTARKATFHPLPGREVVDLPRFSGRVGLESAELAAGEAGTPPVSEAGAPAVSGAVSEAVSETQASGAAGASAIIPAAGRFLEPAEVDARIRALVEGIAGGLEGKIVRLVITDLPREVFRALDHRQLREYRAAALHFHLDARRPEVQRLVGYGTPARRLTLEEEVRGFLTGYWQRSSAEIETERLVALAERYLAESGGEPKDALVEAGVEG
jgi:DNA repair exonuclease SbcCD nuclease subunit